MNLDAVLFLQTNEYMKSTIIFSSKNNNYYLHSPKKNKFNLLSPQFSHYISQRENMSIDIKQRKNKRIKYFEKKLKMLESNGYFEDLNIKIKISKRITDNDVKISLANLLHITFEVTDACNLKCDYCAYGKYYSNYIKRENKNIELKTAIHLLEYQLELWNSPMNYSFNQPINIGFYGGEPLLNMDFIKEIVDFAYKNKPINNYFQFSMTTNGVLLNKHIEFLVKNDFRLLVSLDGDIENNYYRKAKNGKDSFEKITEGLNILRSNYPVYFEKRVNFNAVLHNKNSVEDIFTFFKTKYQKSVLISELSNNGVNQKFKDAFYDMYKNKFESLHQAKDYEIIINDNIFDTLEVKDLVSIIHQYSGFVFKDINDLYFGEQKKEYLPTGTCMPFSRKLFLTVDGYALACERIGQNHILGKVTDNIVEIDFAAIAAFYNGIYNKLQKQCNACQMADSCHECIYYLNLDENKIKCSSFFTVDRYNSVMMDAFSLLEEKPFLYNKLMTELKYE